MIFDEDNFPDLPVSWASVKVEDSCRNLSIHKKIQSKTYKPIGDLPVVDQGAALIGGYTDESDSSVTDKLPVVVFGDHTRCMKFVDFKFAAGADGIKVLSPDGCFLPKTFFRFLQAVRLPDKGYARHFQHLRSSRIPLAPLNEQKRIADKLDALLKRVDACRERLDRMPLILKRFRQAVLATATSGALTEDWREASGLEFNWDEVKLGDVADGFSYGSAAKSAKAGKVPVLRMGNIQNGVLDWSDLVFSSDLQEIKKFLLSAGDVLFNRTNSPELVGKTAVFKGERDAIYAGYLIRVRCGERLLPDYLNYNLNSPAGRDYCWQVKSDGVSQSNINAKKLAAFTFLLPSIKEQTEIVRRVEKLFAFADKLEARYTTARKQVEHLTPALLAKAFRGELVEQDPNDEPASVLLERIRAERAGHVVPKKGRGRKQKDTV